MTETEKKKKIKKIDPRDSGSNPEIWDLCLYVAGQTEKSVTAFVNLKNICEVNLAGKYRIEVIDVTQNPALARNDQIIALPTLVRKLPPPIRKIVGDLSKTERVLIGLDLKAAKQ